MSDEEIFHGRAAIGQVASAVLAVVFSSSVTLRVFGLVARLLAIIMKVVAAVDSGVVLVVVKEVSRLVLDVVLGVLAVGAVVAIVVVVESAVVPQEIV